MRRISSKVVTVLVAAAALAVLAVGAAALASDRAALWYVVRGCRLDAAFTGAAFPCLAVNTERGETAGYAVLRASLRRTHLIVTPLVRIDGIEDPALQAAATPNYVADAWTERRAIAEHASRPLRWDEFGLAINSYVGRSQDQLHIHVECVYADVRTALHARESDISAERWSAFPDLLRGRPYQIIRIADETLARTNVFALAADGLSIAPDLMFNLSLALLGAQFADGSRGFYLLADLDHPGRAYPAHSEDLLDPACRA